MQFNWQMKATSKHNTSYCTKTPHRAPVSSHKQISLCAGLKAAVHSQAKTQVSYSYLKSIQAWILQ